MNVRRFLALLVLSLVCKTAVSAQDSIDAWKNFDFSKTSMKPTQVQSMALEDLKLLRGLVFGRHGRVFKDHEIKTYLEAQPWYKPNPDFHNSQLNDVERRNLDLIRIAEASKHDTIQPGDMRYWRDRAITPKNLGTHTKELLTDDALIICEHHHKNGLPGIMADLEQIRIVKQGDSSLSFYRIQESHMK